MITVTFLADWALRSSVLIASGWVLLLALRVKDPSVRLAAWTAMLCGSLAIPGLNATLPGVRISMPRASVGTVGFPAPDDHALSRRELPGPRADTTKRNAVVSRQSGWARALVAIYIAITGALLLRLFAGLAISRRLLRGSRATGQTTEGIEIRESDRVASPVALGIAPASIVLPADWREWESGKLDAVLAHERSHIRRHDPAVQLLSSVHRALLWYSPLSWFMHRGIVRLAEEVSDDAAVAVTSDRASYAEVLLDFMQRGVRNGTWRGTWGLPMARYTRPEQRIHRILDAPALARGVTRWSMAAILLLGSPLAYVVASAAPQNAPQASSVDFSAVASLMRKGDAQQALDLVEKGLETKPNDAQLLLAKTQLLLRLGRVDQALDMAEKRLQSDPDGRTPLLFKGAALLRLGRYDESRAVLEKLLEAKPDDADAWLELGVLDLGQTRYPEAEEAFRKAYAIDPSNPRGVMGVAETYFQRQDPEKAVQVIADAAQAEPQRADLKKEQANFEFRAQQYDRAIADYRSILNSILNKDKISPAEQADIYNRIGGVYSAIHKDDEAIEYLQKANRLDPSSVAYATKLAQTYDNAGRQREALPAYRQALTLDPDNGVILNNLAYVIAQSGGDLDEAMALAQHARRQLPKSNETLDTIGWIYIKKDQARSAVEVFRDLTGQVPDNPTFLYHYAMALAQNGDKDGALHELNAALRNHPNPSEEKEIKEMIRGISF